MSRQRDPRLLALADVIDDIAGCDSPVFEAIRDLFDAIHDGRWDMSTHEGMCACTEAVDNLVGSLCTPEPPLKMIDGEMVR